MSLRIVLMGTGEFALPPFRALLEGGTHKIVGVYTQPDRTGRGHHRHVNKVKELANKHGAAVFQPERVNRPEALDQLRSLEADVFIVAAYGQIMKPEFLAIPRLGAFNLHGSLLPRHRGAAPVQYSIWKGDREAGVTIFQIEPALDSGPMIAQVSTPIAENETSGELMLRLAELSVELTLNAVTELAAGTARFEHQDNSLVTLAPKISKEDGIVNWHQASSSIDCHVRAMQPWPKAVTWLLTQNRTPIRCIMISVRPRPDIGCGTRKPGEIWKQDTSLLAATSDGAIEIVRIQPEGSKAMDAMAFTNGYSLGNDARFASIET